MKIDKLYRILSIYLDRLENLHSGGTHKKTEMVYKISILYILYFRFYRYFNFSTHTHTK